MRPFISAIASLCILEYRSAVLSEGRVEDSTSAHAGEGSRLFDCNLSLPAGAGTWFDLVRGTYFIDIAAQDNAPIEVTSVPDAREKAEMPKGFIRLANQTRLAIRNPKQDEPATVSVKILRFAR
jgi:hypothetical protein